MIAASSIEVTVVTPEKAVLTEQASSLQFPLEDGQIGILPGRAPMVGRLGLGELTVTAGSVTNRYFIDGGFVQVKGNTVTLLTNHANPLKDYDLAMVEKAFDEAFNRKTTSATEHAAKHLELERNRRLMAILRRG